MASNTSPRVCPTVPGPHPPNVGFIKEFLLEANEFDDQFKEGDVFQFNLSCSGYAIGPVAVSTRTLPSTVPYQYPYEQTIAAVTLVPGDSAPPKSTIMSHCFQVEGLVDNKLQPLRFTMEETDPLSNFISYSPSTGNISLQVDVLMHPYVHETPSIYLRNPILPSMYVDTSFSKQLMQKYEQMPNPEGVLFQDDVVPDHLQARLRAQIARMARNEPIDWHPGSNECVRDLVHPSLYPFVNGESPLSSEGERLRQEIRSQPKKSTDRWGRQFEDSIYQWLPAVFRTDVDGSVSIESYINNLDRDKYGDMYRSLERLFELFLPMFEQVYSYAQAIKFVPDNMEDEDAPDDFFIYQPDLLKASLRGKELCVITKIVEYTLADDQASMEGVFHVEGMSSDHILATGSYTLSRDADMEGGDLIFRRAFLDCEAWCTYMEIPQARHWKAEDIVDQGIRPLGKVATPQGRLICFPNCHIHKLTKIFAQEGAKNCRRVAIVFWLVDPEASVISSAHVPEQQQDSIMTRRRALWHRLQLMKERSKFKGKFNTERKIHLCEH